MRSDKKHIDEFFRNKLQEADADLSGIDQHWDAMKASLATPLPLQPKAKPYPWFLKVAAIAILIAGLTFLYLTQTSLSKSSKGIAVIQEENKFQIPTVTDTNKIVTDSSQVNFRGSYFHTYNIEDFNKNLFSELKTYFNSHHPSSSPALDSSTIAEEQKLNAAVFSSFFQQLKKRPEQFHIDTQRDTTIRCSEGTVLRIPANSFQTATGLAISGVINMQIQEFYSVADIIGNKLSTTSNEQMLETGGMLCIKALFQNEEVKIKPGSALELSMPAPKFNPEMQLFMSESSLPAKERTVVNVRSSASGDSISGNFTGRIANNFSAGINWIDQGQRQTFYDPRKKIIRILNLLDNPVQPVISFTSKNVGRFVIPYNAKTSTSEIQRLLTERYSRYYDKIIVRRQWQPLSFKKQDRDPVNVSDWYDENRFVGDSIDMPIRVAMRLKFISQEDSLNYERKWKEELELAIKRKRNYKDFLQISDQYNFKIENLGWINCDRFTGYPAGRLGEFTLLPQEDFKEEFLYSMIVFKNDNVAMQCSWENGSIKTPRVPLGEQVTVVSIGVKQGKAFTCVKDLTITREKQQLEFKESSPEDFKEQLARLGRVTSRG